MNWNRSKSNFFFAAENSALAFLESRAARCRTGPESTLLELVVACAILVLLASISVPLARNQIKVRKRRRTAARFAPDARRD